MTHIDEASDWAFGDAQSEFSQSHVTARICFDGALVDEIERLEAELPDVAAEDERENRKPQAPAHADRILELTEQLRQKERPFVFRSIGAKPWSDLLGKHPPKEEHLRLRLDHNPDTFPTAAIVASCVTPSNLKPADVDWMRDNLSTGQFQRLWRACLAANVGGDGVGKAVSGITSRLATATSSTTAPREESLAAPSSAES